MTSKKINFATYSSFKYLPQFLQFYNSINKYNNSLINVLCLDKKIYTYLKKKKLENIKVFNKHILKVSQKGRTLNQYISISRLKFTEYLFKKKINELHLIDSDVFFYSNPKLLKKIVKKYNIAFCYHNFFLDSDSFENKYGVYNAGYIFLKNNTEGNSFLKEYTALCLKDLNWNIKKNVKNNFADQTYLEYLSNNYKKILRIKNKGINYGPWNIQNYSITKKKNNLFVNKTRLIFYHFSGVKKINSNTYSLGLRQYIKNKIKLKKYIYNNYISKIHKITTVKSDLYKNEITNLPINILRIIKIFLHSDYIKIP